MKKEEGQIAYEAYREICPVSKFTGDKLPTWEDIDPELKPYWAASERAVKDHRDSEIIEIINNT